MRVAYAYLADTFIFHQKLKPIQLVAALVMIFTVVSVAVFKIFIKKRKEEAANKDEFVRYSAHDDDDSKTQPHPPTLVT